MTRYCPRSGAARKRRLGRLSLASLWTAWAVLAGSCQGQPTPPATGPAITNISATTSHASTATLFATVTAPSTATAIATATLPRVPTAANATTRTVIALGSGPHLFIDDYLIEFSDHVVRAVNQPRRVSQKPIITGLDNTNGFRNVNFTASVLRDPESGLFRMWYVSWAPMREVRFTAYVESTDGLDWQPPILRIPETYSSPITQVMDEGPNTANPDERYKTIVANDEPPVWRGKILYSPDGIHWVAPVENANIPQRYGEIWRPYLDAAQGGYGLLFRWNQPYEWQDAEGVKHQNTEHDPEFVRLFAATASQEFGQVEAPRLIFVPDERDSGETQFYNVSNVIKRGDYYITMLSILRDDLKAAGTPSQVYSSLLDSPVDVYGVGYTVLAWSRDGLNWERDRHQDPYFEPATSPQAWDHAHAWITSMVEVDNLVYLYYGGYKYGHKVFSDRQIGVARAIQDRYVARQADFDEGRLRTRLVTFSAEKLLLNANAEAGEVRVQILDEVGLPIPGFSFDECNAVVVDSTAAPVHCAGSLASLAGRPVQIEFLITNARLFAFSLQPAAP